MYFVQQNDAADNNMEEDDEFLQALMDLPDHLDERMIPDLSISNEGLDIIRRLRNNQPLRNRYNNEFSLGSSSLDVITFRFTDLSWKLLGRYISNNIHLKTVRLDGCDLTDEIMTSLFGELTSSSSLERLQIGIYAGRSNEFGMVGVRSMVPFLQNSPKLKNLCMGNNNIDTECFETLISILHDKDITELGVPNCPYITDISALDNTLPNLQKLNLSCYNIGREGIRTISSLLQKEGSNLTHLFLQDAGIDDQGAEMIASSLKHNKKLEELHLENNNLERNGSTYVAFLKILVDISSVANTYNSNHTLKVLRLDTGFDSVLRIANTVPNWNKPLAWIDKICNENTISDLHIAGKAKVMSYQLDRGEREILCSIQGVECPSIIFADVDDPLLLPKVLDLMTVERDPNRIRSHARYQLSELFVTIVHMAPDLMSYIDREAMIDSEVAKNMIEINALTQRLSVLSAKNQELNRRREMISSGSSQQSTEVGRKGTEITDGKKRKV